MFISLLQLRSEIKMKGVKNNEKKIILFISLNIYIKNLFVLNNNNNNYKIIN